ncbi:MAG: hypothetical protein BGN87_08845 [Rhizobiales bacterium 65-79]|jgi:hypothetical protein|nr:hypothetical protein [Hyphomicrobiales bacterium]OJU01247.1 MAG: hypothetical protein BGN87_08845 [Rhizobiales bacterium 65-79]
MPELDKDERMLAAARQIMEQYEVVLSVLARGENSPYMTEEFRQRLVEVEEELAPYTIANRGKAQPV